MYVSATAADFSFTVCLLHIEPWYVSHVACEVEMLAQSHVLWYPIPSNHIQRPSTSGLYEAFLSIYNEKGLPWEGSD
jgi:hypothetical protein